MLAGGRVVALVPIGSTEPHGPHLPLATDALLSVEVCLRAAKALAAQGKTALVAPAVCYGVTRYAKDFRGAIGISEGTLTALLVDIGHALLADGFAHVCFVNNHLEPEHAAAIGAALQKLESERGQPAVSFPNQLQRRWGRTLTDEYKRGDCHAGRYETSLVMAARPELVGDRTLPTLDISLSAAIQRGEKPTFASLGMTRAYTGAPAEATAAEGEDSYSRLVTMVVTEISERAS
jgi:creatinine amidohydrolase